MTNTLVIIEEAYVELELEEGFLLEENEDQQIWLDGPFTRIPGLKVDFYPSQYHQH